MPRRGRPMPIFRTCWIHQMSTRGSRRPLITRCISTRDLRGVPALINFSKFPGNFPVHSCTLDSNHMLLPQSSSSPPIIRYVFRLPSSACRAGNSSLASVAALHALPLCMRWSPVCPTARGPLPSGSLLPWEEALQYSSMSSRTQQRKGGRSYMCTMCVGGAPMC